MALQVKGKDDREYTERWKETSGIAMRLIETIPLENGLAVEVRDNSRLIAADTMKVELLFSVAVPLNPSDWECPAHYEIVRKIFGDAPRFEYPAGRSFVRSAAVEAVSLELRDAFRRDSLAYLSRPDFPRRFVLSKYREIESNPYRYREFLKENRT
jgi:hypothetical protein